MESKKASDIEQENKLLEKIGELYFKNNNIMLKSRSPLQDKCRFILFDFFIAYLNPVSIVLNSLLIIFFILLPKTIAYVVLFTSIALILVVLEFAIIVPAYSRRSSVEQIKMYYRLFAKRLIAILRPVLHAMLCNKDGTVKSLISDAIIPALCSQFGSSFFASLGITEEIIKLIIEYLSKKGLHDFCSIIPSASKKLEVELELQALKDEMIETKEKNNF